MAIAIVLDIVGKPRKVVNEGLDGSPLLAMDVVSSAPSPAIIIEQSQD